MFNEALHFNMVSLGFHNRFRLSIAYSVPCLINSSLRFPFIAANCRGVCQKIIDNIKDKKKEFYDFRFQIQFLEAVVDKNTTKVKRLIGHSEVDVNFKNDENGETPLHHAASCVWTSRDL